MKQYHDNRDAGRKARAAFKNADTSHRNDSGMRLFIAVNFSDDMISRLTEIRDGLRSNSERGRFTSSGNIHLTLVFIGECDEKQTDTVKSVMDSVRFGQFEITVDRIGRFRRGSGDIWWAGVRDNAQLSNVQNYITKKLTALGFDIDGRDYTPHITLGRDVRTDEKQKDVGPFAENVNAIDLMRSEHIDGKLVYTKIYSKEAEK
ncbi:MAG: RNA 2',3'-cyclic phosphodiesterase [Methanomassiliicoccaceae archaeon]|nr:RNA 2',3'-cyclic phosphodiesterase [Methanomassiliicoccaceae archaeon]